MNTKATFLWLCILGMLSLVLLYINVTNEQTQPVILETLGTNMAELFFPLDVMVKKSTISEEGKRQNVTPTSEQQNTLNRESSRKSNTTKDNWRVVVEGLLYVYAAYYDEIVFDVPVVHVIGMRRHSEPIFNVTCQYTYKENEKSINVTGMMVDMKNENKLRMKEYRGISIYCAVPDHNIPVLCTVFANHSVPNVLQVNYSPKYSNQDGSIAACFCPFHGYSWPVELLEFIEITKLLGVSHFILYKSPVTEAVQKVINYYVDRGDATVLDYDMPYPNMMHIQGQLFTVQNCILYTRGKFNYVEMVDPDELILPEKYDTLKDMLRFLDTADTSGFIFHSWYFCLEDESNKTVDTRLKRVEKENGWKSGSLNLRTQLKTRKTHAACIVKVMQMNKYIMKPWHAIKLTVHYIVKSEKGYQPVVVDQQVGVSHHFRNCYHGSHQIKNHLCAPLLQPIQHTVTHRLQDKLVHAVADKIKKLDIL